MNWIERKKASVDVNVRSYSQRETQSLPIICLSSCVLIISLVCLDEEERKARRSRDFCLLHNQAFALFILFALFALALSRFAEQRSSLLRPRRINSAHSEKSLGFFLLSFLRAAAQLLFSPVLPRHPIILVVCDVH